MSPSQLANNTAHTDFVFLLLQLTFRVAVVITVWPAGGVYTLFSKQLLFGVTDHHDH